MSNGEVVGSRTITMSGDELEVGGAFMRAAGSIDPRAVLEINDPKAYQELIEAEIRRTHQGRLNSGMINYIVTHGS